MPLKVGDVLALFDGTTTPPKFKRSVCICVGEGWFLRINSRPIWKPHMMISAATEVCIEHDSYIELRGCIEYDDYEIDQALARPNGYLGTLSPSALKQLRTAIEQAKTFSAEEKARILAGFRPPSCP